MALAMEDPQIKFLRTINTFCKEHPELFSRLPEVIECLLQNYSSKLNHFEENSCEKMECDVQEVKEEISKGEEEIKQREKELNNGEEQLKEFSMKTERELQEVKDKISQKEDEITEREKEIMKKEKQLEEALSKKDAEFQQMGDKYREDLEEYKTSYRKKIEGELQEVKDEISKREDEITEREKEIMKRKMQLGEALSKKDAELKQLRDKYNKNFEEYKRRLSQAKQDLEAANRKKEDYKSRLASLSEKYVNQDQTHVENILGSNRQSDLEKDFSSFFDHERLDACEKIQFIYCNKEDDFVHVYYPRLACIIFETAYEQCKEVYDAASYSLQEIIKLMIDNAASIGSELSTAWKLHMEGKYPHERYSFRFNVPLSREGSDYLKDVMDGMNLSVKEAAPTCSLDSLTQDVATIAHIKWEKWCDDDQNCIFSPAWHLLSENLLDYINACIKLAWKMVTQIPPMKLEYHCSEFNKEIHRNVSRVQNDQEKEIKCYLWPGLQDGRGRRIRPGEVLCKLKHK